MRPALRLSPLASAAVAAATLLATGSASADPAAAWSATTSSTTSAPTPDRTWPTTKRDKPGRHDGEVSLDVRDYWLRAMPTFGLSDPTQIGIRAVGAGALPSTGEQHFLGFAVDTKYIYNQRYEFPIFGFVGGGAVGQSPRVVSAVDGTMVEMKPWTAGVMTFLLPGIGFRFRERRWMFSANVRMVGTLVWEQVSFANGRGWDDSPSAFWAGTFGARAHVEACRRLDPETRVCLFVEPHLYEFSALNGGSAGLRWEFGQ